MTIPSNVILTRNDGLGDIVLMLPMAAIIKQKYPQIKIAVLGKAYSKDLILACENVDAFIDENDFFSNEIFVLDNKPACIVHVRTNKNVARRAKELHIPIRIGSSTRWYHWFTCNKLVYLPRKKSTLHEAQLNLKLLEPLGINKIFSLNELKNDFGLSKTTALKEEYSRLIDGQKFNVIIHPKSKGSSREWPLQHFVALINMLEQSKFNIFLSGMESEKPFIEEIISNTKRPIVNLSGKLNLDQFISFIKQCDAIIANATGPIHIGAALGINAIGLYPPIRPIHPGRWAPIGNKVKVFVVNKNCNDCANDKNNCACIAAIQPFEITEYLYELNNQKNKV